MTEVAYQNAAAYAKDRIQGRSLSGPKAPDKPADPIIVHPDVRRMLLTARAYAEGGRIFAYWVALMADRASGTRPRKSARSAPTDGADDADREGVHDRQRLRCASRMPCRSSAAMATSREWGMEQFVRDARINMIYEGTNTIQSLDLIGRKVLMDNGAKLRKFGKKVQAFVEENGTAMEMSEFITPLADLGDKVTKLTMEIGMKAFDNQDEVGAAAVTYLRVVGHLVYGYFWARMAKVALAKVKADGDKSTLLHGQAGDCAFLLPAPAARDRVSLIRAARSGAKNLMELPAAQF